MDEQSQHKFEGWAKVEIMGHQTAVGMVKTVYFGPVAFLHVVTPEVPATRLTLEKDCWVDGGRAYAGSIVELSRESEETYVGTGSIYRLTPIKEEDVLKYAPLKQTVIELAERKLLDSTPTYDEQREDDNENEDSGF